MNICFVLPRTTDKAVGGYKIVFEYANRLTHKDHNVSILYLNTNYLKSYHVPKLVKKAYFDLLNIREPRWYELDSSVEKVSDYSNNKVKLLYEQTDVVVATAVMTAQYVADNFSTDNKIYLIQGRENWDVKDEYVDNTYCLGMKNVVVSQWLKDIVDGVSGRESVLIRNPIDTQKYIVKVPTEDRKKHSISVLYNPNPVKGFDNAYKVILELKDKYPDLTVKAFGAYPRPDYFPSWIDYTKNATQQQTINIYNQTQVYLCSSIDEGYGLTGLESMACGCALCSTDYEAVHEYAIDGDNCLLSPVSDVGAQVNNVKKLFEDNDLRTRITKRASTSVNQYSWDVAVDKLIKTIESSHYNG